MLFFLRKLVEALLLPIGMSLLLTIAGVLLRRRRIAFAGALALYIFSAPAVGRFLRTPLERAYPPRSVATAPGADAIVVLSGGEVRGVNPAGVQWGEVASRYFSAFDLAEAGKARLLVFTGAETGVPGGLSQGAIMRQAAIRQGIPPDRIIVTPVVLTTEDEAREVSKITGIHTVLLVTSAVHMPRAVLLFRARGLDVTPFSTDQRAFGPWHPNPLGFIPSPLGLENSQSALQEYYALAIYRTILLFHPLGRLQS